MEQILSGGSNLTRLTEYGVLGILLIVTMTAVAFLYREVRASNRARIEELERATDTIARVMGDVSAVARENSNRLKDSVDKFALAVAENSLAINSNTQTLRALVDTIRDPDRSR
jgi:hypothetical protein